MSNEYLAAAAAYAIGCFIGAALHVRLAPRSRISRLLRRQLALSLVLPLFLAAELFATFSVFPRLACRLVRVSFEALSGHRMLPRHSYSDYHYGRSK